MRASSPPDHPYFRIVARPAMTSALLLSSPVKRKEKSGYPPRTRVVMLVLRGCTMIAPRGAAMATLTAGSLS